MAHIMLNIATWPNLLTHVLGQVKDKQGCVKFIEI
jgi:hypothetical protein